MLLSHPPTWLWNTCDGRARQRKQESPLFSKVQGGNPICRREGVFHALTFLSVSVVWGSKILMLLLMVFCQMRNEFDRFPVLCHHGKLAHDKVCTQLQHLGLSSGKSTAAALTSRLLQAHTLLLLWSHKLVILESSFTTSESEWTAFY